MASTNKDLSGPNAPPTLPRNASRLPSPSITIASPAQEPPSVLSLLFSGYSVNVDSGG